MQITAFSADPSLSFRVLWYFALVASEAIYKKNIKKEGDPWGGGTICLAAILEDYRKRDRFSDAHLSLSLRESSEYLPQEHRAEQDALN